MGEPTLFDDAPFYVPPANSGDDPVERVSADARRTQRQRASLAGGWHPLSAAGYRIRLHADAAPADPDDRTALGLRCRDCRFRMLVGHHSRSYAKCLYPGGERPKAGWPRLTHGPGTDIRGWWPACTDFQSKEASAA